MMYSYFCHVTIRTDGFCKVEEPISMVVDTNFPIVGRNSGEFLLAVQERAFNRYAETYGEEAAAALLEKNPTIDYDVVTYLGAYEEEEDS